MAEFTPGPWHFDGDWHRVPTVFGQNNTVVAYLVKDGFPKRSDHSPEQSANARLIAAAPELLAALELVVKRCGPNAADGAIARAAIAKARGTA